jgi:DNA-binding NarL/FixJ family response regulator
MPSVIRPRLILADEYVMFAESLSVALSGEYDVVGIATNGSDLLKLVRHHDAECILLADLVDPNSLDIIPVVRQAQPLAAILIITSLPDPLLLRLLLTSGANGCLPRKANLDELRLAIAEVTDGRRYLSPTLPRFSSSAAPPIRYFRD